MTEAMLYEPELGQVAFGQPWQRYDLPAWVEQLLWRIDAALEAAAGDDDWAWSGSPFQNTGARYQNDTFTVEAYSWGDEAQPWNFTWGDVGISWYKWLGRGSSINQQLGHAKGMRMLDECLASIREGEASRDG